MKDIRKHLVEKGWKKSDVNKAIKIIEKMLDLQLKREKDFLTTRTQGLLIHLESLMMKGNITHGGVICLIQGIETSVGV